MVLVDAETVPGHYRSARPGRRLCSNAPKEDRYFMTKPEPKINCWTPGGRVSEEITFGEASTVYSMTSRERLNRTRMVTEYGMSDRLGQFSSVNQWSGIRKEMPNDANYSDSIAYEIDQKCRILLRHMSAAVRFLPITGTANLIAKHFWKLKRRQRTVEGLLYHGKLPEEISIMNQMKRMRSR